jgi:hypothetical protein
MAKVAPVLPITPKPEIAPPAPRAPAAPEVPAIDPAPLDGVVEARRSMFDGVLDGWGPRARPRSLLDADLTPAPRAPAEGIAPKQEPLPHEELPSKGARPEARPAAKLKPKPAAAPKAAAQPRPAPAAPRRPTLHEAVTEVVRVVPPVAEPTVRIRAHEPTIQIRPRADTTAVTRADTTLVRRAETTVVRRAAPKVKAPLLKGLGLAGAATGLYFAVKNSGTDWRDASSARGLPPQPLPFRGWDPAAAADHCEYWIGVAERELTEEDGDWVQSAKNTAISTGAEVLRGGAQILRIGTGAAQGVAEIAEAEDGIGVAIGALRLVADAGAVAGSIVL